MNRPNKAKLAVLRRVAKALVESEYDITVASDAQIAWLIDECAQGYDLYVRPGDGVLVNIPREQNYE